MMTREQTQALATIIARGAGHALDVRRPGDDWEGIAEAALAYARACGWSSPTETAGYRQGALEHARCRAEMQRARERVDALELAIAGVVGAAAEDGVSSGQTALDAAIEHAASVLAGDL